MKKIYVIHENSEWTVHLTKRLQELGLPYEEWHLDEGFVDLTAEPPVGVFYSRMSASSHTRDHRYAPELTSAVLNWLESYGRKVFNGTSALRLEVSKVAQYLALAGHGIRTPRTIAAVGKEQLLKAAQAFAGQSFITKHNRAGKGLGVQLFHSLQGLESYVNGPAFDEPVDGITLIQEYIQAPQPFITRCEFVGGKFVYAVQVDTSEGFELCPADACQIGDLFCPVGEEVPTKPKFQIVWASRVRLLKNTRASWQHTASRWQASSSSATATARSSRTTSTPTPTTTRMPKPLQASTACSRWPNSWAASWQRSKRAKR